MYQHFVGVACSIRAIFVIHVEIVSNGIDHSVTRPLIRDYGKTNMATYTWDSLQGQRKKIAIQQYYKSAERSAITQPSKNLSTHVCACILQKIEMRPVEIFLKITLHYFTQTHTRAHVHMLKLR